MQKDNQFQINSIQNEQASSRIVHLVSEEPPLIIYAVGWSDFEKYMQNWNKNLLKQIIKENCKVQNSVSEEEKWFSAPELSRNSEDSFNDNVASELFDNNLRKLITDLDEEDISIAFDKDLLIVDPPSSNISKRRIFNWFY